MTDLNLAKEPLRLEFSATGTGNTIDWLGLFEMKSIWG
jgi:hypothetical protein